MKNTELKKFIKEELSKIKNESQIPLNEGWVYYCDCPSQQMGIICSRPCNECAQGCNPLGPGTIDHRGRVSTTNIPNRGFERDAFSDND